jgi:hypothetical protein
MNNFDSLPCQSMVEPDRAKLDQLFEMNFQAGAN